MKIKKVFKEKVLGLNLIDRAQKAKATGKIKHIAFSFHDKPEVLKEIIDTGHFELMLVQYNIIDQVNEAMIAYAAKKGNVLGIIIRPPWYRTILAYVIYIILLGFLIYVIVRWRTIQLRIENLKLDWECRRGITPRFAAAQRQRGPSAAAFPPNRESFPPGWT